MTTRANPVRKARQAGNQNPPGFGEPIDESTHEQPESPTPAGGVFGIMGEKAEADPKSAPSVSFSNSLNPTPSKGQGFTYQVDEPASDRDDQTIRERPPHMRIHYENLPSLHEVSGPIKGLTDYNQVTVKKTDLFLAATKGINMLPLNDEERSVLSDRIGTALDLGILYTERHPELPGKSRQELTSKEQKGEFKLIFNNLDQLLRYVDRHEDLYDAGYSLNSATYAMISKELVQLRNQFKEALIVYGCGIPEIPMWGKDGNIQTIWDENDLEVLGATYRNEIEVFLLRLTQIPNYRNYLYPDSYGNLSALHSGTSISKGQDRRKQSKNEPESVMESISTAIRQPKVYGQSTSVNLRSALFGNTSRTSGSRRMNEMLGTSRFDSKGERAPDFIENVAPKIGRDGRQNFQRGGGPPDDEDDSSSDSSNGNGGGRNPFRAPGYSRPRPAIGHSARTPTLEPIFDHKLKADVIPAWDGNMDELGRWMLKVNRLAERSATVFKQLGTLVPTKLTGSAEVWYYSLSHATRIQLEADWSTLREAIASYFMNQSYMDRQKSRANRASFRDSTHPKESPSDYFIRKLELLELSYDYSDRELINEIIKGAPSSWIPILTPHLFNKLDDFQLALKFHEETLIDIAERYRVRPAYMYQAPTSRERNSRNPFNNFKTARVNTVAGSNSKKLPSINPPFPKDDSNVSRGRTPEMKGQRACRHCGSLKHWDYECKYARKGEKLARVHRVRASSDDERDEKEYQDSYYEEVSDGENEVEDDQVQDEQDFH